MEDKGITNVRGGSFSQLILSDEQIKNIKKVIKVKNPIENDILLFIQKNFPRFEENVDYHINIVHDVLKRYNHLESHIQKTNHFKIDYLEYLKLEEKIMNYEKQESVKRIDVESYSSPPDPFTHERERLKIFYSQNENIHIGDRKIYIHNGQKFDVQTNFRLIQTIRKTYRRLHNSKQINPNIVDNLEIQLYQIIKFNLEKKHELKVIQDEYYNKSFIENLLKYMYKKNIDMLQL